MIDLENLLLPSDSKLSTAIGDFFSSLQDIAAYPDDQAARIVAIEKGKDDMKKHLERMNWYPYPMLNNGSFNLALWPCAKPGCTPFPSCCVT